MLRLSGSTRRERNAALSEAEGAIASCGGWVTDHHLFSNQMATLNFFLPVSRSGALARALTELGITLHGDVPEHVGEGDKEVFGLLSITFLHNEPDLRRDVPPFG
jgi:hypothetical protein